MSTIYARPKLRMWVYPLGTVQVTRIPGFALSDDLSQMLKPPDVQVAGSLPPTRMANGIILQEPELAIQPGKLTNPQGLRWQHLEDKDDGGTTVAGYSLEPHLVPYNSVINCQVQPSPDFLAMKWNVVTGDPVYWTEVMPDYEPRSTGIAWHSADIDHPYEIASDLPLPANQCFAGQMQFLGTPADSYSDRAAAGQSPFCRVKWGGGQFALAFAPGEPPALQRLDTSGGAAKWVTLRQLQDWGTGSLSGEPFWLSVLQLGGRTVVQLAGNENQAQAVYSDRTPSTGSNAGALKAAHWAEGPLHVEGVGIPFTFRPAEVAWGDREDSGAVNPAGQFQRDYHCNRSSGTTSPHSKTAFGYYPDGSATRAVGGRGYNPNALATVTDVPVQNARGQFTGQRSYTCALTGSNPGYTVLQQKAADEAAGNPPSATDFDPVLDPDGAHWAGQYTLKTHAMFGAKTPLVQAVALRVAHTTTGASNAPLDLRPAIKNAVEQVQDPAYAPGATWRINLDRRLIRDCIDQGTGQPVGNNWRQFVGKYHYNEIDVGWQYEDGTETPWVRRFSGYIASRPEAAPGYGHFDGELHLRDLSMLLQKPAGLIDGKYAPLELIAAEKGMGLAQLYGRDVVRYILETAVSPAMANALVTYFPAGHYSLMDWKVLFDPPNGSGFIFPPPFGASALDWIKTVAGPDFGVFYFGQVDNGGNIECVPCYGNYFSIMAGAPSTTLPDYPYGAGDLNKILDNVSILPDPEHDFNRVLVYGKLPRADNTMGGLVPALPQLSAEGRIQDSSTIPEQNISRTWERTTVLESPIYWRPGTASIVASSVASWLQNVDVRRITLRCRGLPFLWWGHKVVPRMNSYWSDSDLELDGKTLRVMRITNVYDFDRYNDWHSELTCVDNPTNFAGV